MAGLAPGCGGDDRPFGRACQVDGDCGSLACVEGACAERYDMGPGPSEEGPGGPVRVFAIGLGIDLEALATVEDFDAFIRATVEADVAPYLATDRPNLLVFPENTGLLAALSGSRAAAARAADSSTAAFFELSQSYGAAIDYYRERTPHVLPIGRAILLAGTDVMWRTLEGTFAGLASEHGVHVAVTYDVADATLVNDPALAAILVDESVGDASHAWVADTDEVFNQTLFYGPDGSLLFAHRKEYLVPDEEGLLALTYGAPGNVGAGPLPFAGTASVISKDAWMPDVLDRLALDGTRLMVQPEAFSGWGVPHGEDMAWAPDVVKESGWAHVQRYPEFRVNAMPCISGNLFEMVWDCQSAIVVDGRHDVTGAFIGQDPDVGFGAVAPWVVEDDGVGTLEERRERLMETGVLLLPGSGDALENAYATETVWLDVDLGAPWPDASPTGVLAAADAGEQRRPDVATLEDGTSVVVWEDTRDGPSRLYGARVGATGEPLGSARPVAPHESGVRAPRLAAHGEVVHAVWLRVSEAGSRVFHARSRDGGRSFADPVSFGGDGVDAHRQHPPAVAVDAATGTVHAVYVEGAEGALRIMHARSTDGGRRFDAPVALEAPPTGPYNTRLNRWRPTVAAHGGQVAVAWGSFRPFRWIIEGAVSDDGGRSFGPSVRWDDADVPHETIHSDPELMAAPDGGWLLAWTDLRVRWPDHDARVRWLPGDGSSAGATPSVSLAVSDAEGRPQWAPSIALTGGRAVAVWQDLREGNRVGYAQSSDGGRTFGRDEALQAEGALWFSPRVTAAGSSTFLMVSECTASGQRRICTRPL
jgi:predicted amidohydrolase